MKLARIVIDCPAKQLDKYFDYAIPEALQSKALVGMRAEVPFGQGAKPSIGYIIKVYDGDPPEGCKSILSIPDSEPLLSKEALYEAYWIKSRYFCAFSEAIRLFLPTGAIRKITTWVRLCAENEYKIRTERQNNIAAFIREAGGICEYEKIKEVMGTSVTSILKEMGDEGIISFSHTNDAKVKDKFITLVTLAEGEIPELPEKMRAQKRAIKILSECKVLSMSDLCLFASVTKATVDAMQRKGMVIYSRAESLRSRKGYKSTADTEDVILTAEQKTAIDEIQNTGNNEFKPVLIHGVTGSGKTEVYMHVVKRVIDEGGSAMILVPEIALTHQMVGRFTQKFGELVAVLHSGLSPVARYDEWKRIKKGKARVIVGARSAVFAPCQNLKIIVVDEEHEDSYKSESGVRYNAREVALCRAKTEGAKVVLASATPSVESYYRAQTGTYALVEMNKRYNNAPLPDTHIVDMREELHEGNRSPVSRFLREEIEKNVQNGEQSILFLNKRGHSSFVSCRGCGYVPKCPKCSVSLTYHSISEKLICHYCGYRINNPEKCPECGSTHIKGFGTGTQKLEERLENEFEGRKIIRMDTDTTSGRDAHERILTRFRDENVDILLGTQMISKGLDFPNVTLVGVLAADQSLNTGDYRAAERTFCQITQVCGRAGRGEKKGRAVIQTYMPDHPTIIQASRQDYRSFYDEEIIIRNALKYPPFCDIIDINLSGSDQERVKETATQLYGEAERLLGDKIRLYRPTPCRIDKINNVYRWHFWMKCVFDKEISRVINEIIRKERRISVIADLNPLSI